MRKVNQGIRMSNNAPKHASKGGAVPNAGGRQVPGVLDVGGAMSAHTSLAAGVGSGGWVGSGKAGGSRTKQSGGSPAARALRYCWVANGLNVLVPKQRGEGYLKVPYGHHFDAGLDRIATQARCELTGLDGALSFAVPGSLYHGPVAGREAFVAAIVPMLCAHYGWEAVEISVTEYWALNLSGDR